MLDPENPDKSRAKTLNYFSPAKDQLQITGTWKARNITVSRQSLPLDSISLNRKKIKWLRTF